MNALNINRICFILMFAIFLLKIRKYKVWQKLIYIFNIMVHIAKVYIIFLPDFNLIFMVIKDSQNVPSSHNLEFVV